MLNQTAVATQTISNSESDRDVVAADTPVTKRIRVTANQIFKLIEKSSTQNAEAKILCSMLSDVLKVSNNQAIAAANRICVRYLKRQIMAHARSGDLNIDTDAKIKGAIDALLYLQNSAEKEIN